MQKYLYNWFKNRIFNGEISLLADFNENKNITLGIVPMAKGW